MRPCPCCNGVGAALYCANFADSPFDANVDADYEDACQRCEHLVTVATPQAKDRILSVLRYDKRASGEQGLGPLPAAGNYIT